jgi:class 3 adenylate cyclase
MTSSEREDRTWLCSVVFMDIAGYSEQSVTRQVTMSGHLQGAISEAIATIAENERIVVDTGDGAALCFLGDPVEALLAALQLRESLAAGYGPRAVALMTRIGIHLGPVKVRKTLSGVLNPLGDGINNAQRVMSFAEPLQILVSRSFYDVIACLSQEYAPLFARVGVRKDKHAKEHEIYALQVPAQVGTVTARVTRALVERERSISSPLAPTRGESELQELAQELAEFVGPLASVLVKKTARQTLDDEAFYRMLAEVLPEGEPRKRFLAAHNVVAGAPDAKAPRAAAATPAARTWDEADLIEAEQRLASFLGPVAKILVRRAAKETADRAPCRRVLRQRSKR